MAEFAKNRKKKKGKRGRNPTRERIAVGEPDPIEVQKLADQLDSSEYHHVFLRDTERKELPDGMSQGISCSG